MRSRRREVVDPVWPFGRSTGCEEGVVEDGEGGDLGRRCCGIVSGRNGNVAGFSTFLVVLSIDAERNVDVEVDDVLGVRAVASDDACLG